jgi:hypothetical protein
MSATQAAVRPIHCDGCTLEATAEHLRRRIARLEWASRFRPIHISTLILSAAPPANLEDHFYYPNALPVAPAERALCEDLLAACGIDPQTGNREAALRKFQHEGFFVAQAVECPVGPEAGTDLDSLLSRLMPTLARRVCYSYRPKSVLLLSQRLNGVAQALGNGIEAKLLLDGAPVAVADPADAGAREHFREQVRRALGKQSSK